RLVVDAGVETELLHHVVALRPAPRDTDRAAALQPGDLADHAAYRPRGRRHDDGFARLRLADIEQPDPGGHAGHAEHAEVGRQRDLAGIDLVQSLAVGAAIVLPAKHADDLVAGLESRVARL